MRNSMVAAEYVETAEEFAQQDLQRHLREEIQELARLLDISFDAALVGVALDSERKPGSNRAYCTTEELSDLTGLSLDRVEAAREELEEEDCWVRPVKE